VTRVEDTELECKRTHYVAGIKYIGGLREIS